jgi:antitoxin HigA-1
MTVTPGIRMKAPAHPGRFVRTVILEPLGLSVTEAARALGITRVALSRLLNEQAALSPDMAIRLDKAFGADMETLMRMQNSYDIAKAKQRRGEISVARFKPRTPAPSSASRA